MCESVKETDDMYNLEYLSERDLKYFEKKEARGEAIIIRIEPETLLSLDLDELFKDRGKDQTLSAEELGEFFQGGSNHIKSAAREPETVPANTPVSGIEDDLLHISLPADQRQNLLQLINDGITDDELIEILEGSGSRK